MSITYSTNSPHPEGVHWQEIPPDCTSPLSFKRYREFVDGVLTGRVKTVYPNPAATAVSAYVIITDLKQGDGGTCG